MTRTELLDRYCNAMGWEDTLAVAASPKEAAWIASRTRRHRSSFLKAFAQMDEARYLYRDRRNELAMRAAWQNMAAYAASLSSA